MAQNGIHRNVVYVLFGVIVGAYLIMAVRFPLAYIASTYEDLVGEWAQVYLLLGLVLLSVRLAVAGSRFRVFFTCLAAAAFYVAMEEISWGQRLLNIPTPEFFKDHNLQGETNLHNLLTGPVRSATKTGLEYGLATGLVFYGLVYPIARARDWGWSRRLARLGLPVPPIYLWPYFVSAAVLELQWLRFNEAEIAEILIPVGLCILAIHCWVTQRRGLDPDGRSHWDRVASREIAVQVLGLVACVVTLSLATTYACYTSPRLRSQMEQRFENGVEKFAGRYKHLERWRTAGDLYLRVHAREPERASVLRNLADCSANLGQADQARGYLQQALAVDLARLREYPDSPSAELSLATTYERLDDGARARSHLENARQKAADWVLEDPGSAQAAYRLGKALRRLGQLSPAMDQFRRACDLDPRSRKYRTALYKAEAMNRGPKPVDAGKQARL